MKLKVFVGPKGSGKDTCAAILQADGRVAGKIPFAGPLKAICSQVWGIPLEEFEDPYVKEKREHYEMEYSNCTDLINFSLAYVPMADWDVQGLCDHINSFECMEFTSRRHILQFVGTEILRAFDPDWHCKAAFSVQHIGHLGLKLFEPFAVTDCRFVNEYNYLKENHDCEFFYVERPEAEERLALATHQSEIEIRQVRNLISNTIKNDGTIEELKKKLQSI